MTREHQHQHECRCGNATLVCSRADCAVTEPYQCPTCDHIERDEYWQAVEMNSLRHPSLTLTTEQDKDTTP